jgi:hypothetical protein
MYSSRCNPVVFDTRYRYEIAVYIVELLRKSTRLLFSIWTVEFSLVQLSLSPLLDVIRPKIGGKDMFALRSFYSCRVAVKNCDFF